MRYNVHIYRTIKSLIDERQTDEYRRIRFNSESELYYYVRNADYVNDSGTTGNHILEAITTKNC